MSDNILSAIRVIYVDPLVADGRFHFTSKTDIDAAIDGDILISPYIDKLDEEIFSNPPLNLSSEQIKLWNDQKYGELFHSLLNKGRGHSYSIVQFSADNKFQTFSETDRIDWIFDEKKMPIGIKISKQDTTDKELTHDLIWGKAQCYLFKFAEGDNKSQFAKSDLNQAMWTIAVTHRQNQSALDLMCANPVFKFAHLGKPTPEEKAQLLTAITEASVLSAFGASEEVCKGLDVIEYESYDKLLAQLNDKRNQFAGATRLPLAFYNGERTSGSGTGGAAENVVEMKINKRKIILFNKIKPVIIQIFAERHGMDVSNIELDLQEESSLVEEDDPQTTEGDEDVTEDTDITANDDQTIPIKKKGWFRK